MAVAELYMGSWAFQEGSARIQTGNSFESRSKMIHKMSKKVKERKIPIPLRKNLGRLQIPEAKHRVRLDESQPAFSAFSARASVCVCVQRMVSKLTKFTLPALEPGCAVANEGLACAHTRPSVLAGHIATVMQRL